MGGSIKNFLVSLKNKDALVKLIAINAIVFLAIAVLEVFSILFELPHFNLIPYVAVSSGLQMQLVHFWTLITYMFVHFDIWHILFNMLMLYWFGRIFLLYFTSKNLVALYVLGGLVGALFFIVLFNTIPYFIKQGNSYMIGASASVMAIVFASAFYNKEQRVGIFFLGSIKIIYIAFFLFILDFISLGRDSNLGGHVAHIGGAILGYFYAIRFLKGKDITKGMNKCFDLGVNLFKSKPKPKMRVMHNNKRQSDYEYNSRRKAEADEVDNILDKVKQSGYSSLSADEKKRLFDASNK